MIEQEKISDQMVKLCEKWMNTEDPIEAKKIENEYNRLEKKLLGN